ncbi:MAG: ECF-type sigma factor [Planctomycetota bacterium]
MSQDITQILKAVEDGDQQATDQLLPLVYAELRRLAAAKMASERPDQTLQPTALVHEAFMRLLGGEQPSQWDGRGHFFAAASEAMRRILIDAARKRSRLKRGGALVRVELKDDDALVEVADEKLLELDDALQKLESQDPEAAKLVELRYFTGLTIDETAETLGVSPRTVKRNWAYARAWLQRELMSQDPNSIP